MYTDTHAHLNFKDFDNDFSQVIESAFEVGVKNIIVPSSNLVTSKKAIEIAENNPGIYAAVGLHPIHIKDQKFDEKAFLRLAKNKKVVAIGETGLDYYHHKDNQFDQQEIFVKHLKLANLVNKPVILHSREAADDILSTLMSQNPLPKGVFHCFSEDLHFAKVVTEMGFYISFTGLITFTKNTNTYEVIQEVPLEKILIETDCPYMAPESHRGKRNEPAFVTEVAKKIAEIKKIPLTKVAEITTQNAKDLFKLS